jgi:hypothetical protein
MKHGLAARTKHLENENAAFSQFLAGFAPI